MCKRVHLLPKGTRLRNHRQLWSDSWVYRHRQHRTNRHCGLAKCFNLWLSWQHRCGEFCWHHFPWLGRRIARQNINRYR